MVSIIESRARAVDLMSHNYYELLYAFHINRHNYRKGKRSLGLNACSCLKRVMVFLIAVQFVFVPLSVWCVLYNRVLSSSGYSDV